MVKKLTDCVKTPTKKAKNKRFPGSGVFKAIHGPKFQPQHWANIFLLNNFIQSAIISEFSIGKKISSFLQG